ncbi:transcriptional regulator AraC family [Vibrio maritimus]|uniref:Transcriptional regulator AraC family n=1 Tax=Vibrio maritimus TaxID=990268 RepID=A0A090SXS6_9VIBR|nr:transcriptional regulator AraC family [Vibrio maritimus]
MSKEEFCHLASFEAFDGMDVINAQFVDTTFGKHAHGEFVITLVDAGVQQFFHKGATHNAISGDICVISPDEIHTGSKGCEQGWRYRGIYQVNNKCAISIKRCTRKMDCQHFVEASSLMTG